MAYDRPTEYDVIKTQELEKYLESMGLYESQEEAARRLQVLRKLDQIVLVWVKTISRAKGLNEQQVQEANAMIFTSGSYRLGVHGPGSVIDTLCVGPQHATREEDFFGELHMMLSEMPEVTELRALPDDRDPVMKFKFNGVSIDLVYAKLSLSVIPQDLDILEDLVLQNADAETIRSLNGCRVTDQIVRLVPNIQNFCTTLRCIRFWAKRRCIYSNVIGFLGGISWALLVASICQRYPNALPNMLVSRFFTRYSQWEWPNPVTLYEIEEGLPGLPVWDSKRHTVHRFHLMPIITPAYPCMNSSYHVSSSTLHIMTEEFRRGATFCVNMEIFGDVWSTLFEHFSFFETYSYFVQININAENAAGLLIWKGLVESHIFILIKNIEVYTGGTIQCHPHPGEFSDTSRPFRCSFFVGLWRKKNLPGGIFGEFSNASKLFDYSYYMRLLRKKDLPSHVVRSLRRADLPSDLQMIGIRQALDDFMPNVNMHTHWSPGMNIRTRVVEWNNIPAFVY